MATNVTLANLDDSIKKSCYNKLHVNHQAYIRNDMKAFLTKNAACVASIVPVKGPDGTA